MEKKEKLCRQTHTTQGGGTTETLKRRLGKGTGRRGHIIMQEVEARSQDGAGAWGAGEGKVEARSHDGAGGGTRGGHLHLAPPLVPLGEVPLLVLHRSHTRAAQQLYLQVRQLQQEAVVGLRDVPLLLDLRHRHTHTHTQSACGSPLGHAVQCIHLAGRPEARRVCGT